MRRVGSDQKRINLYMHERLNLSWEVIPDMRRYYFRNFGTTMRGLIRDFNIDRNDYLQFVHDVPLNEYIRPDERLRQVLTSLPQRKLIFTNADVPHAERVLNLIGIADCFDQVIDIIAISPECKPMPAAFRKALELSGETDVNRCAFADDSVSNLAAAKQAGFYAIRVGSAEPSAEYDAGILTLHDLPAVVS